MLTHEENELLVRTGPGTPMGQLFRSYWIPALLEEELPANDCAPVKVTLLSEKLIAFRDSQVDRMKKGDELPPGVIKLVKVFVASKPRR